MALGQNFLRNNKIEPVINGSTLAASDVDSTILIDMQGYEGCAFIGCAYKSTAGGTTGTYQMVPRHSAVNTSTTGITDLGSTAYASDTAFSTGDIGKTFMIDVYRPTKRYLTVSVNRTGVNVLGLGTVYAVRYGNHKGPVSQTTTYTVKNLTSPTT
jgi:hypothetical protein